MNKIILGFCFLNTVFLLSCANNNSDSESPTVPSQKAAQTSYDDTGSPTCKAFDASIQKKCAPSIACTTEKTDACHNGCQKYCPASQPPKQDPTDTTACNGFDASIIALCAPSSDCKKEQADACKSNCLTYCTQ